MGDEEIWKLFLGRLLEKVSWSERVGCGVEKEVRSGLANNCRFGLYMESAQIFTERIFN